MHVAHERLKGLDRDRVLAIVGTVLRAHNVEGVELIWGTDQSGWVLELTVERPDSRVPGAGITLAVCSEISRDLSAALDAEDVIAPRYRLEVGSPGLDRALYSAKDYERFAGQVAKLKLREALEGHGHVLSGTLHGLNEAGEVQLETDRGLVSVPLQAIESGRLQFTWSKGKPKTHKPKGAKTRKQSAGQGK
ncbi:MAG TPA: ribosome maturation factor RimP [Polyangiaceae bacterium]|nr:ribosome maturation factor RimP [Polyangiaceae bacterium]